jgi:hypothetical protein
MSAKTLDAVQIFNTPALTARQPTYSVAPASISVPAAELPTRPAEVETFLDSENPLGCARGVVWVMAFNAIAFLTAFSAWATFKYLL